MARANADVSRATANFFILPPEYWLISLSMLSALSAMNCPVFRPKLFTTVGPALEESAMHPKHCNETNIQLDYKSNRN
jgi:hypothetical protein